MRAVNLDLDPIDEEELVAKQRVTALGVSEHGAHWSQALRSEKLLFISGQMSRLADGSITALGDAKEQAVSDLAGRAGDGHTYGVLRHRGRS